MIKDLRQSIDVSIIVLSHYLPSFTSIIPTTFIADASASQLRFGPRFPASHLFVHLSHFDLSWL